MPRRALASFIVWVCLMGRVHNTLLIGIWRMKCNALPAAWIYAVYVMVNLTRFIILNPPPLTRADAIFDVVYSFFAIVLTLGPAIALTRRRRDLT